MNLLDLVLIIVLVLVFTAAIRFIISNRRKGNLCSSCGGGCSSCAGSCSSCGGHTSAACKRKPSGEACSSAEQTE